MRAKNPFEDTKGVIRRTDNTMAAKSKKSKSPNNDPHNTTQKTKN
jgi:hypothetical protein